MIVYMIFLDWVAFFKQTFLTYHFHNVRINLYDHLFMLVLDKLIRSSHCIYDDCDILF